MIHVFVSISTLKSGEPPNKALAKETCLTKGSPSSHPNSWIRSRRADAANTIWEEKESKEERLWAGIAFAFLLVSQRPLGDWCSS